MAKVLFSTTFQGHAISISRDFELFIDEVLQDKDTSLPIGIPLLSCPTLNGKIRRMTNDDINISVDLRHTGIGTLVTVYANHQKIASKHCFG